MSNRTILEFIEDKVKSDFSLLNRFKKSSNILSYDTDEVYSYYQLNTEFEFDYALFKLYCFCDYSIEDIYKLLVDLGTKYKKSDLSSLSYSDFVTYTKDKRFVYMIVPNLSMFSYKYFLLFI